MTKEKRTPGYYAVIPSPVLFAKNISDTQRILYAHISTLCNKTAECHAGNEYFAEVMSKGTDKKKEKGKEKMNAKYISVLVNDLKKKGYIQTSVDREMGNIRKITLTDLSKLKQEVTDPIQKIQDSYPEINGEGYPENSTTPYPENSKHNNISNNNTSKNIITEHGSEGERKEFGNSEINELLKSLMQKAKELGIAYDKTDERNFARHILTAQQFEQITALTKKTRQETAVLIMELSMQYGGDYPAGGPKKIYQRASTIINAYILEGKKKETRDPIQKWLDEVKDENLKAKLLKEIDSRKQSKLPITTDILNRMKDRFLSVSTH